MRVPEAQLQPVLSPGVLRLAQLFEARGYGLRVAGGAVRDLLSGIVPQDLDFATTATPQQMKDMFTEEGVRMISETGEKHGTITARIEEENFECTTLRIDKVTDGRRAEVEFVKDWKLDAFRRDLTINSMFLGLDGTVYDYADGAKHLEERRVEFVGDCATRIQEDYLRILRYFRFYGRIAKGPDQHNQQILESFKTYGEGLARISGERIWMELRKILSGNYAGHLLSVMTECGLTPHMGLPATFDGEGCAEAVCRGAGALPPMAVLAAGLSSVEEAAAFVVRVKCSNKERDLLLFIVEHRSAMFERVEKDKRAGDWKSSVKLATDLMSEAVVVRQEPLGLAKARSSELLRYCGLTEAKETFEAKDPPFFPVPPRILKEALEDYRKTSAVRRILYERWRDSDYAKTREDLLDEAKEVEASVPSPVKRQKKKK